MRAFPLSLKPLKLHRWIAVLMNGNGKLHFDLYS